MNEYLDERNTEDLGRMLMAMLSEFWVMRDRIAILEQLLEEQGTIASGAFERFTWSEDKSKELEVLRDKLVATVLGAPLVPHEHSVDQILARAGLQRPGAA